MPRKPLDFAPQIGGVIFYVKRCFCGYLDGPWGLKTHRATPKGPGRLSGRCCCMAQTQTPLRTALQRQRGPSSLWARAFLGVVRDAKKKTCLGPARQGKA